MKFPSEVMARVFEWAYENQIDITLARYERHDGPYPVLRFHRNGKNLERAFYHLTSLTDEIKYAWRDIALQLCVEPLDLEDLGG
jgi:hypothetical protein